MKKVPVLSLSNVKFLSVLLCLLSASMTAVANDYTTYLTPARGFTEVTTTDDILSDADYYYILAPAETNEFIVGIGAYERKPDWTSAESKALRYHSSATDPILDLTNFFTIEKSGSYIGLRNVVYNTDLFQTHDGNGFMYVNTYTDKTLDEWSYLIPTFQDGYWLFENGKYPMSSEAQWKGYMGSWTPGHFAVDEPIALNRTNASGDQAGHYRLFRIKRNDLTALRLYATILTTANGFTEVTTTEGLIDDPSQCYLITSAEEPSLFVGVGPYEEKPSWAGEDTKALRYRQAGNPVADLSNFFTIEKEDGYIGLRNVVDYSSLFQTHDNAGFMYVLTYTEPTMSAWCYLIPTYQNGYWLFESGKYPMSSENWACGYLGPWNKKVEAGEPIALNRRNTEGDEAGHYRLWRISRSNLFALMQNLSDADLTWKITNPSFENGETGWTLNGKDANGNDEFKAREYDMTGKAGGLLMNAYQWWAPSLSVTQTVTNLPAGEYELSGMVASWKDRPITFTANSITTTASGVHADGGVKVKANVTIGIDGEMTIEVGSTTDWWTEGRTVLENETQGFFKLDDVQLKCNSLAFDAMAVRLPNNQTTLVPNQWYYYETDYNTDFQLVGSLDNLVYTTDGTSIIAAERVMTLPAGRTYFKTTAASATLNIMPYRNVTEGTFTAVALNVDGLPNKVATYTLNEDGPGESGTKKISQYLASKGYDIIGCSEDFNYNGALMESLNENYSCGKIRKTLSVAGIFGGFPFDTDGLNLIWKNNLAANNESWTRWNDRTDTDGNQYVKKGYRHYDLTLPGDVIIDVFILHMDAGDTNATGSRESQWRQLAGAVNGAEATRPKLIIGDTNSRWTREDIKTNFMDRLNSNLVASDVWVEFYRNRVYPTTDMGDLTDSSDPTNYTNYEIVDKIIYINPKAANTSQLIPQSFKIENDYTYDYVDHDGNTKALGDHRPVVVTFKYVKAGDVVTLNLNLPNDGTDNVTTITNNSGATANVTLSGRTLYKDESWNTICLPFDMTAEQVNSQLAPAGLMTFSGSSFESSTGTLTLNFADATTINAGTPYIIKWNNADNIINPVFTGVVINNTNPAVVGSDGAASFVGTYAPVNIYTTEKKNLYLGNDNKLYYPTSSDFNVNAFRAYFQLNNDLTAGEPNSHVKSFVLNFDGEEILTGIAPLLSPEGMNHSPLGETEGAPWYDLSGRKLSTRQIVNSSTLPKGIYINQGRKIVIK